MKLENSWLTTQPIAHRGFYMNSNECPENSLQAFDRALAYEFAIEIDVHLLSDGEIAVFHDDNLQRMTGVNKLIRDCNSKEIKVMRLLDSDECIPLFNEVLEFIHGKVPLLIELKNNEKPGLLEEALSKTLRQYQGAYAVQSFNPYSLQWFRIHAPEIIRGQLSGSFEGDDIAWYKKILLKSLFVNLLSTPAFVNYNIDDLPNWPVKWQRIKGTPVLGWTAKCYDEYKKALQWCDNVIFEGFNPVEKSK